MKTLQDLFLGELADMLDAEHRLVKALPKMAKAATCTHLQKAILSHLKETEGHVTKIGQVFESFGAKAKSKTCKATVGLLEEGDEIAEEYEGSPVINAALISAAQKVEHYEISSYGCLHEWAGMLGNKKAAGLLEEILEQEKAANEALNALALARSNPEAMDGADKEKSEDAAGTTSEHRPKGAHAVSNGRARAVSTVA